MAYVYQHIRDDNNQVFYIGIGTSAEFERAYRKRGRSSFWNSVTKKYGFHVEILFDGLTWEQACVKEKELIKLYGRRNNNTGLLVNLTDGGEGNYGLVVSDETKQRLREINLGKKQSDETRAKRRLLMLGNKHNLGKKATPETIEKLRIACAGNNKGNKLSDEQKAAISVKSKGRNLGVKRTDEQRANISLAVKRWHEKRKAS